MRSEIGDFSLNILPIIDCQRSVFDNFVCGNGSIERFLKNEAYLSHINKESSTSLVFIENEFIGYFTLKHTEIQFETEHDNPGEVVNCLEIAKIGVCTARQRNGIGKAIVDHIIETAYMINEKYVIGFAISEKLDWYRNKFGFHLITENEYENDDGEPVVFIYLNLDFPELLEELVSNP